jgi:hypothetical protein
MIKKEKEKLIREAGELLSIPNIGQSLKHKILELKLALSRNIDYYQPDREPEIPKRPHLLKGTVFKITRLNKNLWIPSLPGHPEDDVYRSIPPPIVDYITELELETGVINMQSGLKFPGLKGRVFNLSFEKHAESSITGIISEVTDNECGFISPENLVTEIDRWAFGEKQEKIEVIKLLLYYLITFDNYYHHVANEFFLHWKQLIDNQLLTRVNVNAK